ncbi:hypothetical protein D3C79_907310 [compost metagenome]
MHSHRIVRPIAEWADAGVGHLLGVTIVTVHGAATALECRVVTLCGGGVVGADGVRQPLGINLEFAGKLTQGAAFDQVARLDEAGDVDGAA